MPAQRRSKYPWVLTVKAVALALAPVVLLLVPRPAESTSELMVRLPAHERFQCMLCHTVATPTQPNDTLNLFGTDFKRNGNVWNRTLAALNSDGDACSNGFELGDRDGDGKLEPGAGMEQANPGDPTDCRVALTESTWGLIKRLFNGE